MNTERLILRNRTRERIAEMLKQPQEQQLAFFGFKSVSELKEKLIRIEKGLAKINSDYRIFDLIEKQSQKVIGSCGFHNWIVDHDRAEIGYALHKEYQGQGYMTEALKAILIHGFEEMKLNRIEALIGPANSKSINLVEKLSFVKEGLLRGHYKEDDGSYDDSILFSLLKLDAENNV